MELIKRKWDLEIESVNVEAKRWFSYLIYKYYGFFFVFLTLSSKHFQTQWNKYVFKIKREFAIHFFKE